MACPRRLVSATVTWWSAASAFWMTTRVRAVTDEADVLTRRSSFTGRATLPKRSIGRGLVPVPAHREE